MTDAVLDKSESRKIAPGPKGSMIMGSLSEYKKDIRGFYMRNLLEHGDIVRFRLGPVLIHLVANPQDIKHVFVENGDNYGRGAYRALFRIMGNGLITSDGTFWRRQRRIMQPLFAPKRIATFSDAMMDATREMLTRWESMAADGKPVDIAREMMRTTLQIIGVTMLSRDISNASKDVADAIEEIQRYADHLSTAPFPLPTWVPTPGNLRFRKALGVLDALIDEVIAEARKTGHNNPNPDLLTMLMNARDEETGESMNDKQLRDEVMTMFLAGHETTSNALTWIFYLLSKHPEIERKLRAEIESVIGNRYPTLDDIPKMPYLDMVIQEGLRMYPPVWIIARSVKEDDVIGGYHIPKGSFVVTSPYITHYHPAIWENPEGFDPERFNDDNQKRIPKHGYIPFGGGKRMCIGNNFSFQEMKLMLASVLPRFRLNLTPGYPVVPETIITLRPKHGLWMNLEKISAATGATPAPALSTDSDKAAGGCPFHH